MSVESNPNIYADYADVASEVEPLRIVVAGGGSGAAALLKGIRETMPEADLTGLVAVTDDGGSTGRLMEQYYTQPVGDLRRGLSALIEDPRISRRMEHRLGERDNVETVRAVGRGLLGMLAKIGHEYDQEFATSMLDRVVVIASEQARLAGHTYGNLLLTAAVAEEGSLRQASLAVGDMVDAKGRMIPVSDVRHRLVLNDGGTIHVGEHTIGSLQEFAEPDTMELSFTTNMTATAETIDMERDLVRVPASQQAIEAIDAADVFVAGPGSWLTSVLPVIDAEGIRQAVEHMDGQSVLVPNIEIQAETRGMEVADFLMRVLTSVGKVDAVVYNHDTDILEAHGLEPVVYTKGSIDLSETGPNPDLNLIGRGLADARSRKPNPNDVLQAERSVILTRGDIVAEALRELVDAQPSKPLIAVA